MARRIDTQSLTSGLRGPLDHSDVVLRPLIGWREWVQLPDLNTSFIEAKIDTGARSSSLDAIPIEAFRRRKVRWMRFSVFSETDLSMTGQTVEARLLGYRDVRSSTGHTTHRPVIETTIQIGPNRWLIELTLTNRRPMGYRLLLGRSAISGRFHVDAGQSFLAGTNPANAPYPPSFG